MENENERIKRLAREEHELAILRGDVIENNDGTYYVRHTYWQAQLQVVIKLQDEVMEHMRKEIQRKQRFIDNHLPKN